MSFIERAESMVQRGDFARAAFMLANGLMREPDHRAALERLLDIYLLHISSPGAERDILRVLDIQDDGFELYEFIESRLDAADDRKRIESLRRIREREGLLPDPPPEEVFVSDVVPVKPEALRVPVEEAAPGFRRAPEEPQERRNGHDDVENDTLPFVESGPVQREAIPAAHATRAERSAGGDVVGTSPEAEGAQRPGLNLPGASMRQPQREDDGRWQRFQEPRAGLQHEPEEAGERESATTGMFSSIDLYVEEQQDVNHLLERRRKRRLLLIFALTMLAIAILIFVLPGSGEDEASSGDSAVTEEEGSVPADEVPAEGDEALEPGPE